MHTPERFTAVEIDARKRRLIRLYHLPASDRRFLVVRWVKKLIEEHRRCCVLVGNWFDVESKVSPRKADDAVLMVFAAIRQHMRAIEFLKRRYNVTAAELVATTI